MILSTAELKHKLQQPLPGLVAHQKMAPSTRATELADLKDKMHMANQSAVLILLFPDNKKLKTVFIQRSEYDGVHSGQIAFPGGRKENGDENFEATALRETFEEIGVPAEKIEIIGQLSDLFILPSNFIVKPFVGYCTERPGYILDKKEVQSTIEVDLDEFFIQNNIGEKEFSASSQKRVVKAPYFNVNNIDIWGATAMITSELLDVLKN